MIVAQSLVTGRFVQLTPVFSSGEKLANNATIPMERTAVDGVGRHQGAAEQTRRVARSGDRWQGSDIVDRGAAAEAVDVLNRIWTATARPSGARSPRRCPT